MERIFEIRQDYNSITIEKKETKFRIEKSADGDIWFTSYHDIEVPIDFYSSAEEEWRSYIIFERLMKCIVGKYVLSDEEKDECSFLPKDFIDLQNKTIIWHSDSENDHLLKLQLNKNEITVSIVRDRKANNRSSNNSIRVRIRTHGSDYGNYYQEFENFFSELFNFACQVNTLKPQNGASKETQTVMQKRLSIFSKFKKMK